MLGHLAIFGVVGAIMVVNAVLLAQMGDKVATEQETLEEAVRPAALELIRIVDSNCKVCFDTQTMVASLKNVQDLTIAKEEAIEYTSDAGVELLKKYALTRVPALLIRGELDKAFTKAPALENVGTRNTDGTLLVSNIPPPYIDVASGAVKGTFTMTYLADASCQECYDVASHRRALQGLAMTPSEEKILDLTEAEGRALVTKYQITSVPTILLSGDLQEYAQFAQVWPQVGTVEKDGTHVFRAGQQLMGAYKDLKTGKVVKPAPPEQVPTEPSTPAPITNNQ